MSRGGGASVHPVATYRVQLGDGMSLHDAAGITDYLGALGASHVYCSPFLQTDPAAGHGYAVVDYTRVDQQLGGEAGRRHLVDASRSRGLGMMVDLVPNHMSVSLPHNRWFWEVLEHGPSSRYAGHFDVDWDPPDSPTRNKVLLPILGDHYGREVEAGTIQVHHADGRFTVHHHDHELPASPRSVAVLLADAARASGSDELGFVSRALSALPSAAATDPASRRRRHADAAVLGALVTRLSRGQAGRSIDEAVARLNASPDGLDAFLDLQNYRLTRWRMASQELGYRRFFDIDTLIGIRVEDPAVFADSHALVLGWVADGEVEGLRIDHPDGLRRPGDYLDRLREEAPRAWVVVEKILEGDEELPPDWPVEGTTGYEFLNDVTALFVDPSAEEAFTRLWYEISGSDTPWPEVEETAKRLVLREVLAGDLNRLAQIFADVCEHRRRYRDFTRLELTDALAEALVAFDVYRTYVPEEGDADPVDRARIVAALGRARAAAPDLDEELFDLLGGILSGDLRGHRETELRMRFQQVSGPVMAKGVEDTAFYRYLRLAALCEVGGDPARFGWSDISSFHDRRRRTQETHPSTLLSLSTHDTKRSEDVRARLAALTHSPEAWEQAVRRWHDHTAAYRPDLLDGATEYLVYQTIVGAHPIGPARLLPYLEKATKEAKQHTSWTDPDPEYDETVAEFARRLVEDPWMQDELESFLVPVVEAGRVISLAQKVVHLTAPGVPDLYQGTELWDSSLVDPDNRRTVDYDLRRRLLADLSPATPHPEKVLARAGEGLPKLWVVHTILALRRRRPEAFGPAGTYLPLDLSGTDADHLIAYGRGEDVVVAVPRLTVGAGWADTTIDLPPGTWTHLFDGSRHAGTTPVGPLFESFPVAVMERSDR